MKEQEQKMKLPKLDDLFTIQEQRDYEKAEKVEEIDISNIKDFPNHPFKVNNDEKMQEMVNSVKEYGVILPVIVRPKEDGTALFEELRYGTYYIKEIKAPKDYELSSRIAKVEINDKGIFVDDEQLKETDSTIKFTFENKKIEVPKTGDESKIKLFAGAMLVSLLGIGYIVLSNYKKNKDK